MLSIAETKKLLGAAGEKLSDAEIKRIRDVEDQLAEILFEL
jgi:hypothetical protein